VNQWQFICGPGNGSIQKGESIVKIPSPLEQEISPAY